MTEPVVDGGLGGMPRRLRVASEGYAYHVLNRAVGQAHIFGKTRDYEAMEEVLGEAKRRLHLG